MRGKRGRPRRRPDVVPADRGYDHDKYRRPVWDLGVKPPIARRGTEHGSGLAPDAGSWNARSPTCTGSAACGSAGRSATTSMQPRPDVREKDVTRLSPFVRHHVNMLGRYSFQLPEPPGGLRPLRDKDDADGS
ncbi:hypothetical protein GCM10017744_013070 [Streptomyces antimycoticus]